ncbi:uncharacterized protein EKO05_0002958 [Ascochyta rabiei]|uniref:Transferase n=1 Tax=Didymella rabiei TaxID=5454 RepID=A0A162X4D5_DIDRA|nr:uncharacterized protein EKO05_0002958 [Ascochyta rabiei]KZM19344.1 transferase [Ascochyta rabiei]UPX12410.1 hypothetical protein EKO05_0002958 [Ascochyta rabiei]
MATPRISPETSTADLDVQISPKAGRAGSAGHTNQDFQSSDRTEYDLTKLEDVKNYLREISPDDTEFELHVVSGGTANYVYRFIETGGYSEIFKHAAGHLASDPACTLDPERMDYEASILGKLSEENACHCTIAKDSETPKIKNTHVHVVKVGFYKRDIKFLNLEDGGSKNLKDAYLELSAEDVRIIGTELGKWLAGLHGKTPTNYVSSTAPDRENNNTAITVCRYSYRNLPAVLSHYGYDAELGHKINNYFGGLIEQDEECICHGDFWPGNVLLRSDVPGTGPHILTVIDWEMVRIGNSATDVGQFAAEAFLLDKFHGNKGLHAAFIRAYFKSSAVSYGDREIIYPWMTRVAIHFAVHIAFWPSRKVHWTDGEDTEDLIGTAVVILQDIVSPLPNARTWRVFEGLSDLDMIAQDLRAERGDPYENALSSTN